MTTARMATAGGLMKSGSSLSIDLHLQIKGVRTFSLSPSRPPATGKTTNRHRRPDNDQDDNHLADERAAIAVGGKLVLHLLEGCREAPGADAAEIGRAHV